MSGGRRAGGDAAWLAHPQDTQPCSPPLKQPRAPTWRISSSLSLPNRSAGAAASAGRADSRVAATAARGTRFCASSSRLGSTVACAGDLQRSGSLLVCRGSAELKFWPDAQAQAGGPGRWRGAAARQPSRRCTSPAPRPHASPLPDGPRNADHRSAGLLPGAGRRCQRRRRWPRALGPGAAC